MGKPVGTYLTLENLAVPDEDYHREVSVEIARYLKELILTGKKIISF